MSTIKAKAFQHPSATSNNITFNADGTHTVNSIHPTTSKNLLINGGMNIWQRSTSVTGITTTSYNTADRWETYMSSLGTWTQSQSTDVPSGQGFGYSLKMDCTTAVASPSSGNYLQYRQKIEGQNLQHLLYGTSSAKSITLSFWVKSNKTGTYIVEILDNVSGRHINKSYTINVASTWEKKTLTFEGNQTGAIVNSNATGIFLNWWLGAGSSFTSGTLQTSWGAYSNANKAVGQVNLADSTSNEWYITGCQLEVGDTATQFEFEPYEATLRKCQRYYFEQREGGIFGIANTTNVNFRVPLPVTMRVAPSASLGGSGFRVGDMISVGFFTGSPSIVVNYNGPTIAGVRVSGFGGLTAYRTYLLEPTATYTGYIKLDAEL